MLSIPWTALCGSNAVRERERDICVQLAFQLSIFLVEQNMKPAGLLAVFVGKHYIVTNSASVLRQRNIISRFVSHAISLFAEKLEKSNVMTALAFLYVLRNSVGFGLSALQTRT